MRKYQIEYQFENNDDSDYAIITIKKADDIEQVIINFKNEIRLYKRITIIKEI